MLNNKRMFKYIIKQLYDGIESSPLEKMVFSKHRELREGNFSVTVL